MMVRVVAALLSSACFAVVFQVRGMKILLAGISGGLGYLAYLAPWMGSTVAASFWASCAIALYSEAMARAWKSPATVFLVAGLIPIVPGGGMYRCMYQALEGDLSLAASTCYQTLLEAGAIAIGVVTVSSLVKLYYGYRRIYRRRKSAKENPDPASGQGGREHVD